MLQLICLYVWVPTAERFHIQHSVDLSSPDLARPLFRPPWSPTMGWWFQYRKVNVDSHEKKTQNGSGCHYLPFNLYSLMLRPVSWTNLPFWSKWLDTVGFLEFIVLLSSLCRRDFDHRLLSWVGSAEVPTAQHRPSAPPHLPPKSLCSSAMGEPLDTSGMAGASVGNKCKRNSSGSSTASTTRHYIIGIVGRKAYQPGKAAPDLKRRKKKQQDKKRTKKEEEKKTTRKKKEKRDQVWD